MGEAWIGGVYFSPGHFPFSKSLYFFYHSFFLDCFYYSGTISLWKNAFLQILF